VVFTFETNMLSFNSKHSYELVYQGVLFPSQVVYVWTNTLFSSISDSIQSPQAQITWCCPNFSLLEYNVD